MRLIFKDKLNPRATQIRVEGTSTTISGLNPGTKYLLTLILDLKIYFYNFFHLIVIKSVFMLPLVILIMNHMEFL